MRLFLIMFLSMLTFVSTAYAEDTRRMAVQGEGRVDVAPDMATISVGVSTFNQNASEAMNVNSDEMGKVLSVVTAAGVAQVDIQTQQLSLRPRWENRAGTRENEIVGYEAVNSVSIRVREITDLGRIIDTVSKVGANRIQGIQFSLQDPRPHQDEARKRAVADAKVKAELYAKEAGVNLGEIMRISEPTTGIESRGIMMADMAMSRSAAPIAEGELSLSATINILFALE